MFDDNIPDHFRNDRFAPFNGLPEDEFDDFPPIDDEEDDFLSILDDENDDDYE